MQNLNTPIESRSKTKPLNKLRFFLSRKVSRFLLDSRFKSLRLLRKGLCLLLTPTPPKGLTVVPTIFGFKMAVDPLLGRGLEESIFYYGEYEAGTVSILEKFLNREAIFLDAGANIGFLSFTASKLVGNKGIIYAIEPHPIIFKILQRNIKINRFKNVRPLNLALGEKVSRARIYDSPINRGAASLIKPKGVSESTSWKVKVETIDNLLKTDQIKIPDFIKIDVQGFELEVLKGAKRLLKSSSPPILCVEFGQSEHQMGKKTSYIQEIYQFIKSINHYSFSKLQLGKGTPSKLIKISKKDLPSHDNVFCFPK